MDIAVDFDGTCVSHEFPKVGKDIGAVPVLKRLVEKGHNLILFTMRSNRKQGDNVIDRPEIEDVYGDFLQDAVDWFKKNDIPLYGVQRNPLQNWTTSPKCYAHLYIDDMAIGCPLVYDSKISDRPFVCWTEVERILKKNSVI